MAEWDLTKQITKYLDKHLIVTVLDFQLERDLYKQEDLLTAKFDLLKKTKMIDFAISVWQEINKTTEEEPKGIF